MKIEPGNFHKVQTECTYYRFAEDDWYIEVGIDLVPISGKEAEDIELQFRKADMATWGGK